MGESAAAVSNGNWVRSYLKDVEQQRFSEMLFDPDQELFDPDQELDKQENGKVVNVLLHALVGGGVPTERHVRPKYLRNTSVSRSRELVIPRESRMDHESDELLMLIYSF